MLQAHSFLWHYLWVAPNLLLACLGILMWRRGLQHQFPVFVAFALLASTGQLTVYGADMAPWVAAEGFWRIFWAELLIEGFVKMLLIGELFGHVFGSYAAVAGLGKILIRGVGAVLVLAAVSGAAMAHRDNYHWLIAGAHLLEQTIYIVECGLLVFIFILAGYFRLAWSRRAFGIALGLSISACVHLADWAVTASGALLDQRYLLDFLNMAVYHICVILWFYYILVPAKSPRNPTAALPLHNLEQWNRELERLLKR